MKKKRKINNILKRIASILFISIIISFMPHSPIMASGINGLTFTNYVSTITAVTDSTSGFIHPGIGVTKAELENVRTQVKAGVNPWSSYLTGMMTTTYASKSYSIKNQDSSDSSKAKYSYSDYTSAFMENTIQPDAMAAYVQALLYYFTGDEAYRRKSITIIRLWSQLDPSKAGTVSDGKIKMGYPLYYMISAAELLKYTDCVSSDLVWTDTDNSNFITNFIKPPLKYYIASSGAVNYWMNQYSFSLVGRISADIFMNDITDYNTTVEMATVNSKATDQGSNGALARVMRRVADDNISTNVTLDSSIIQLAEMGRDQAHAADNIVNLSNIAYMFDGQGTKVDPKIGTVSTKSDAVSMFNFLDNRLLRGTNYFCKYNLGYKTTWYPLAYGATMTNGVITKVTSTYDKIYDQSRGKLHNFETLYYHYATDSATQSMMNDDNVGKYLTDFFNKKPSPESGDYISDGMGIDFWIHIPASAANTGINFKGESTSVTEIENRYTLLSGTASEQSDSTSSYLNLNADTSGTEISILDIPFSRDRSDYSVITLKIKTNAISKLELRRDIDSTPFKIVDLPNTDGSWTYFTINMNIDDVSYSQFLQDTHTIFLNVVGQSGNYIDIDNLRINPTDNYAPQFEDSVTEKTINTYVGGQMSISLGATDKNNDALTYSIVNAPSGVTINANTGLLSWNPETTGKYVFDVQVTDGKATSVLAVTANVESDLNDAVSQIIALYDSTKTYTSATKNAYTFAYTAIQGMNSTTTDKATLNTALNNLQEAVGDLQLLTPLLSDSSMNYSNIVESSLDSGMETNLVDDDTQTFTGDLYPTSSSPAYFTLDFGRDYAISSTSFKIQSRAYFAGRASGAAVYGSNDGSNWTKLTNTSPTDTGSMIELPVIDTYKNSQFRYLKITSSANPLNASEFRILGTRHETTNRITSVSIKSNDADPTRALPGDKVILTFQTTEAISNANVLIAGQTASITSDSSGMIYTAEIILNDNPVIGMASFNISYNTVDGDMGLPMNETTDSTNVFLSNEANSINVLDGSVDLISSGLPTTKTTTAAQVSYLFDNNLATCSDFRINGSGTGSYIIFDFKNNVVNLSRVELCTRQDSYYTRIAGTIVLGSNDGSYWTNLSSDSIISSKKWQVLNVNNNETYRYIKITNPNAWYGNMSELRLFSKVLDKAYLEDEITIAKAIEKGNYTYESWNLLQNAIEEAKSVADEATTQSELDAELALLEKAINNLEEINSEITNPQDAATTASAVTTASAIKELNDAINYADAVDFNSVAAYISKIASSIKDDFDEAYAVAVSALNNAKDTLLVSIDDAVNYAKNLIDRTNDIKTAIANAENSQVDNSTTSPAVIVSDDSKVLNHVSIYGTLRVGSTLKAILYNSSNVEFTSNNLNYQWYRVNPNNVDSEPILIEGAADNEYTLTSADKGYYIRVAVSDGSEVTPIYVTQTVIQEAISISSGNKSSSSGGSSGSNSSGNSSTSSTDKNNSTANNSGSISENNQSDYQWKKNIDGTWSLDNKNGQPAVGWQKVEDNWYLFDFKGIMETGWQQSNSKWYYLNLNGDMRTGWFKDTDDKWYYLNSNGDMRTGWFKDIDGNWYYLKENGLMTTNEYIDGYYLDANGIMEI